MLDITSLQTVKETAPAHLMRKVRKNQIVIYLTTLPAIMRAVLKANPGKWSALTLELENFRIFGGYPNYDDIFELVCTQTNGNVNTFTQQDAITMGVPQDAAQELCELVECADFYIRATMVFPELLESAVNGSKAVSALEEATAAIEVQHAELTALRAQLAARDATVEMPVPTRHRNRKPKAPKGGA